MYNFYVYQRIRVSSIKFLPQILQSEVLFALSSALGIIIQKGALMKPAKKFSISRISLYIFHIGLPLIILYLCAFLATLLSAPDTPAYVLFHIHRSTFEHIIMSATIIIVGGFGFDMLQKLEDAKK